VAQDMEQETARKEIESFQVQRTHRGWHLFGACLVLAWLAVMWFMFSGPAGVGGVVEIDPVDYPGIGADSESNMGVYHAGRRLGAVRSTIRPDGAGVRFEQHMQILFNVSGMKQELDSELLVRLDGENRLKDFSLKIDTLGISADISGRPVSGGLEIKVRLGQELIEKKLPMDRAPVFPFAVPRLLAAQDLSPGKRYSVTVFDPQSLANRPTVIEVLGTEAIKTGTGLRAAVHLRRSTPAGDLHFWIDDEGRLLKEEIGLGLTLIAEKPRAAGDAGLQAASAGEDMDFLLEKLVPGLVRDGK